MSWHLSARRGPAPAVALIITLAILAGALLTRSAPADAAASLPPSPARHVASLLNLSCGLSTEAAEIHCWGGPILGPVTTPPTGPFVQLTGGSNGACGLRADGSVACWGSNPVVNGIPDGPFTQVDTDADLACAVRTDSTLACWGSGGNNQLLRMPTGPGFTHVEAASHACALRTDGTLHCWGRGFEGQTAVPPLPAGVTYTKVSLGALNTCAITSQGSINCWGRNVFGESNPPAGDDFVELSLGAGHGCALHADGTAACWGGNTFGEADVPPGLTFSEISTGGNHSCGLTSSTMRIVCWGRNNENQASPPDRNFGPLVDPTPPAVTATVVGTQGLNGWYTSTVDVTWTITDAESPAAPTSGCDPTGVTDTGPAGTTLTCTAQSAGGEASGTITVLVDTEPPALAPTAEPTTVEVGGVIDITPNASDAGSGVAGASCDPVDTSQAGSFTTTCSATDHAGLQAEAIVPYTVTAPPPPPPPAGCPKDVCRIQAHGKLGTGKDRPELEAEITSRHGVLRGEIELEEGGKRGRTILSSVGRPTSLTVSGETAVITGNARYRGTRGYHYELTLAASRSGRTVELVVRSDGQVVQTWTGKLTGALHIEARNARR